MDRRRTVAELLRAAGVRLETCGVDRPGLEAELLLAHALGVDRGRVAMMLAGDAPLDEARAAAFRRLVRRRCLREPLAYITGRREFRSIDLEVGPAVLIPRPETERLVEEALDALPAPRAGASPLVADVGTGSGAVAVSLALERPDSLLIATDLSLEALEVAARNAARHGVSDRVRLVQADLLEPFAAAGAGGRSRGLDLVAANPPYVALSEKDTLMPEVRDHEPSAALFAGASGMDVIERLAPQAAAALAPGGWLVMEVAADRARRTAALFGDALVWQDVEVRDDHQGLPRILRARRTTVG